MSFDPDRFRRDAHAIVDHMADYLRDLEHRPILLPSLRPGDVASQLASEPPELGQDLRVILQEIEAVVEPGLMHWGHPAFLAYFGSTTSAPGIYAEMLAAAYNVSAMLWKTSPAATELETLVLSWLREWMGLPKAFEGIVYDTASVSSMHAMAAAREGLGLGVRERGLTGRPDVPPLRVYVTSETHSSIDKCALALGLGLSSLHRVATDHELRMDPANLEAAIIGDLSDGHLPLCVVATVGTTSTTSVDPVAAIADVCMRHGVWLHVDAAYGGALGLLLERRSVLDGCERADSLVVNGHKWLMVPLDFSVLYTRHLENLREAFALTPDYLETNFDDDVRNYMDYGVQLGRRFRALKAWMVFRTFGRQGLADTIREHIRLATAFASWLDQDPDFERLAPTPMAVVCFRAAPRGFAPGRGREAALDALNQRLMHAVNATGRIYLSQTRVRGSYAIRLAVGNLRTTDQHIREAWNLLHATLEELLSGDDPLAAATQAARPTAPPGHPPE